MRFVKNINENGEIISLITYNHDNPLNFSEEQKRYWIEIDENTYEILKAELDMKNATFLQEQAALVEMNLDEEIGSDIISEE